MATFILPTSGPATYRGKYPARVRSVSYSRAAGLHVELNDGTRLWAAKAAELPKCRDDMSATLAEAVPMTAEQYAELQRAAHIRREAAGLPGYDAAAEESRAILESIQPDEKAETAKAALFAAYGTDRAELEAEAKAAAPVRLVQTRGPDGESRLVRPDSPEAKAAANRAAGLAAYRRGDHASEAEADEREADERAARVSPDAARALGAQSCACNLERSANPFPADSAAGEAWDSGYSEAMADWRAERRAEIADRYGDEAADRF